MSVHVRVATYSASLLTLRLLRGHDPSLTENSSAGPRMPENGRCLTGRTGDICHFRAKPRHGDPRGATPPVARKGGPQRGADAALGGDRRGQGRHGSTPRRQRPHDPRRTGGARPRRAARGRRGSSVNLTGARLVLMGRLRGERTPTPNLLILHAYLRGLNIAPLSVASHNSRKEDEYQPHEEPRPE